MTAAAGSPATLAECSTGTGVVYSSKTSYQPRACLGCKELYALADQERTASSAYSNFVATQICDSKTLGIAGADEGEDKDGAYWVGLAVVLVAVVVVAALAAGLHCWQQQNQKAQDKATRAEGERRDSGRKSSSLGGTPAGAQAAAGTASRNSQVKTQTTEYDEEAPQTHRKLLGDGENVDVDVGFGTELGQRDLIVKDGHAREAKTNGDATHQPDEHDGTKEEHDKKENEKKEKEVTFKEGCEVEVLEPKVEPWEQKQVEMQALGARAQSDVDLGDGEVALGAAGRPKAKTFSGNVRERMETQKDAMSRMSQVMRESTVVQKRKLNQSVIMENESFGEIAGSHHSGEEAGAIAGVAKTNAGGASVAIGDGFAVKDAAVDAGSQIQHMEFGQASSNAGGAGGVVVGTGTVVVGIAAAGTVAHVDNEDVSGHTEARTEAHALQPDLIEEEETPVFDRAANVSGGGAVGAAGDEREINADIQRQNPSPRAVRTAMTASDIVPAGQAGAAVGAAAAASVVVDARPLVERPTASTPAKAQLEPTSVVEPVTPEARVEMNIEGAESAQFGNPSQVTVQARKSEKCNCHASDRIVTDFTTIQDGKCPKCFRTFRRVQIMYTEQSQN